MHVLTVPCVAIVCYGIEYIPRQIALPAVRQFSQLCSCLVPSPYHYYRAVPSQVAVGNFQFQYVYVETEAACRIQNLIMSARWFFPPPPPPPLLLLLFLKPSDIFSAANMSFWNVWSGVFAAIGCVVAIGSAWFFRAPLLRLGSTIRNLSGRRDHNRTTTSVSTGSDPLTEAILANSIALRDLQAELKGILAEQGKQTVILGQLLATMDHLPSREGNGWIAEVRLRRPGHADLGDQTQSQNRASRSDVASG